jgi:putative DNA primase/helicase
MTAPIDEEPGYLESLGEMKQRIDQARAEEERLFGPPPHQGAPVDDAINDQTGSQSEDDLLSHLAGLTSLEYEKERVGAAKKLKIRASVLDQLVRERRPAEESETGFSIEDIEPWPDKINLVGLLDDVVKAVRRFIVCEPETAHAVALWAAFTWFVDVVQVAPLAVITAPEKRCGKSQLLFFLSKIVCRPLPASNISTAALFRTVEAWKPTFLIDEADSFMKDNEDMRGLLNSGHTRDGAFWIKTVGDNHEPKKFSTWGAKAIAGISAKNIAGTITDRAILFELRRKHPHETVDRLRYAEADLFETIAAKLSRFAEDHREDVLKARPVLPHELNDRAQDNWEPLLAIADVVGGHWPKTARHAALKLAKVNGEALTIGVELLADIQEIFETKALSRISTIDLIAALCEDDEKPWATYNKGKAIAPRQVATRLREYGITSNQSVRFSSNHTTKGYHLDQFKDSFNRYILPAPPPASGTESQPNNSNGLSVPVSVLLSGTESFIGHRDTTKKIVPSSEMCPIKRNVPDTKNNQARPQPAPPLTCDLVPDTAPPTGTRVRVTI